MDKKNAMAYAIAASPDLQKKVFDMLYEVFPKRSGPEPVYSIGFQRWQKLTKKQSLALHKKFDFDGDKIKDMLQTATVEELLARL